MKLDPNPPRLYGRKLSGLAALLRLPGVGDIMRHGIRDALGVHELGRLPETARADLPIDQAPIQARAPRSLQTAEPPPIRGWPREASEYLDAYKGGRLSPSEVVARAFAAIAAFERQLPPMAILATSARDTALAAAAESTLRIREGRARPLEGVPFFVKDQHAVASMPTRFGSNAPVENEREDATIVARMKAAGAIVLGKTLMTEWGLSPIGVSAHTPMPRNAHRPERVAGGSSTGSAVGVALGLAPFATAADAGGSVRTPASLNGVFGLKPTFGRISRVGETFGGSLNHVGVIGASTRDLTMFLDTVAAAPDPQDALTLRAPPAVFADALSRDVKGLVIGIDARDWEDCATPIAAACQQAVRALEQAGATVVPVQMPLAKHVVALGVMSVGCEGLALVRSIPPAHVAGSALDVQLSLLAIQGTGAAEYLDVQRLRAGLRRELANVMRQVDVVITPSLPITAPRYYERDAREPYSDPATLNALTRYSFLANLTGTPALSVPVGIDPAGVPIGMQIIGDAWDDVTVLAVSATLERIGAAHAPRAFTGVDLLA